VLVIFSSKQFEKKNPVNRNRIITRRRCVINWAADLWWYGSRYRNFLCHFGKSKNSGQELSYCQVN